MKKAIFLFSILFVFLQGQNYYYEVWRASSKFYFAQDLTEDGNRNLVVGGESAGDLGTFMVFDASVKNLERAYTLPGTGWTYRFLPEKMIHFGDTVVVAGRNVGDDYAIITKFTKGSITSNPTIIRTKVFAPPVCNNCGYFYSEFKDLKMKNDTLYAVGMLNDNGNRKAFLVLMNKNLDTLKTVTFDYPGNTNSDYANALHFASNGDLLIMGTTYGANAPYGDMLLIRTTSDGQLIWSKVLGYEDYDYGMNLAEDENGDIYVVGNTRLGGTPVPDAILLFKLSPNGTLLWDKYFTWNHNSKEAFAKNWKYENGKFIILAKTYTNVVGQEENPYLVIADTTGNIELIKRLGPASTAIKYYPVFIQTDINNNKVKLFSYMDASSAGFYAGLYSISTSLDTSSHCFPEDTFSVVTGQGMLIDTFVPFFVEPAAVIDSTNNSWIQINPVSLGKISVCDTCTLPAPVANFSYTNSGLTVTFTDNSSDAQTYLWDFGDGNTSTQKNPNHTYTSQGNYTVCLTVSNDCGTDSLCQNITITTVNLADAFSKNIHIYVSDKTLRILNIPEKATITLYNTEGRKILTRTLVQNNISIPLNVPQGLYFYSLEFRNKPPIHEKIYIK